MTAIQQKVTEPVSDELALVQTAKSGDVSAFEELVRRYERPVFSLLYRMVRDRALAEDLAQETFVKVLNGIKSYRPEFRARASFIPGWCALRSTKR